MDKETLAAAGPRTFRGLGPRGRWVVALLLVLDLGLRVAVAARPLALIDGLTVPDDAYLSLSLARAIGRGEGPRYGLGYTNGFQPLYVFLMAPVYTLVSSEPDRPVHVALFFLALCDTLTLAVLLRLAWSWSGSLPPLLLLGAAWISSPYVAATTANGLETMLATLLLVASLAAYARLVASRPSSVLRWHALVLGLLLGFAVLARVDSTLLALAIALDWLARVVRGGRPAWRGFFLGGAVVAAAAFAVNLPWLLYSYRYTGAFFPVSGRAVRFLSLDLVSGQPTFASFYGPMLVSALRQVWTRGGVFLSVAAALLVVLGFHARTQRAMALAPVAGLLRPAALYVVLMIAAYAFFIFTPWYYDRYLFPLAVVALVALAAVFDRVLAVLPAGAGRVLAVVLVAGVLALNLADGEMMALFRSEPRHDLGYRELGLWARDNFPRGSIVGAPQSGALGYFADDLVVVNLDGVVNAACLEALQAGRVLAYARAVGVEYVVGWHMNVSFLERHSSDFQPGDLVKVRKIEGFQSWGRDWMVYRLRRDH
jgi:hypothetical protein